MTTEQIAQALNIKSFPEAKPGKNWHRGPDGGGAFEAWSREYGYPDGFPMYGSVTVGSEELHIYYLNDANDAPIILRRGETPKTYNVPPKPKSSTAGRQNS
ncbi:hypothetical protein [Nannocystis punicea]|uniref:Uncharacterized protein n=1 Tax=Nannocystis punicea TaxID=2995304 RepID=A0ABY7GSZ9_9BACT|nr:hypothetical protein [Nannocystis poenicansa]WAS90078.1 hypothetical protein O0S08_28115 [Nannocystis poenicansa]